LIDMVKSSVSSLASSLLAWSGLSSEFIDQMWDISHPQYEAWRQIIGRQTFGRQWRLAALLKACGLSRRASWFYCELWCHPRLGIGSICCNEYLQLGNMGKSIKEENVRYSGTE
jgi:hypothetical protein